MVVLLNNRQQHWQETLATIVVSEIANENTCKVLVEGMNVPRGYLLPEIAEQIINIKTKRLRATIAKKRLRKIAFSSIQKNGTTIQLYFKEDPVAAGREYLVKELYESFIGHGCVMSELVKFTIDNISYPVLIMEAQTGDSLQQLLTEHDALTGFDSHHLSQMYLASIFEMQEDGKGEHYIRYSALNEEGNAVYKLSKIDLDHAFLPSMVKIKNNLKLQQKVILYAINDWLNEKMSLQVMSDWLALDKKRFFKNLLDKLIERDSYYYKLFGLNDVQNIKKLYSRKCPIFIESLLPATLIDEWLRLSERVDTIFTKAIKNNIQLTHKDFLAYVLPLQFKRYQEATRAYPKDPLNAYRFAAQDLYIFNRFGTLGADVHGDDLLLSTLNFIPQIKHLQQRTLKPELLLNRLLELENKTELLMEDDAKYSEHLEQLETNTILQLNSTRPLFVHSHKKYKMKLRRVMYKIYKRFQRHCIPACTGMT